MAAARAWVRTAGNGFGPRRLLGGVVAASLFVAALLLCLPVRSLLWPASLQASSSPVPAGASSSYGPFSSPPASPAPSSARSTRACEARLAQYVGFDNPMQVKLVAAYAVTAGDVASDDEHRHGASHRSGWRDRRASEFEAVCFFDAQAFGVPPASVFGRTSPVVYNRLEEIVRPDGVPVVYVAGFQRNLAVRPIPSATP